MSIMPQQVQVPLPSELFFLGRAVNSERNPLLLMTSAVSLLMDDVLEMLFSAYQVQLCSDASEIIGQRKIPVVLALLSGPVAGPILAMQARVIRTQWPLAKIILIGRPPPEFEDYLYDDAVAEGCDATRLTAALYARSEHLWNQIHGGSSNYKLIQGPAESDPTKAEPSDVEETTLPRPRDLPADEQDDLLHVCSRLW